MPSSVDVEVLTAVFQVRECGDRGHTLHVLLHRASDESDPWRLPGGLVGDRDTLPTSAGRHLGEQADLTRVAHLEQLSVFSDPDRVPARRTIASTFLGLVPRDIPADPATAAAAWFDVDDLPELAGDHRDIVDLARQRLAGKLSYTNIAFALAPGTFSMSELSEIYGAALGYPVDATNLLRILSRRGVVVATGTVGRTGRTGGRPPSLYAFADSRLRVTDEFATLRPPL
ncbi:NUDIX hydrolase [Gordonia sp. PDNC005]|uniref:NUDIX hydrolase n=1 Tax=unclassified Gordonia (in: high G+C Gram-positive bacteria) TaxID=2657482 RepID=UPI00196380EF|nr:NUDIX domain-containing protein [Gordonia sp. PDNC005]QRY64471.1 NUDIX hydrolase [Gordonia sp. PDNC005]